MQAQIHEIAARILEIRPLTRGIGDYQSDTVAPQLRDEFRCGET
jgi:hypothetical protein